MIIVITRYAVVLKLLVTFYEFSHMKFSQVQVDTLMLLITATIRIQHCAFLKNYT